jgi:multidrug efflux pump subunit AcrA (membrane-fusion protein)
MRNSIFVAAVMLMLVAGCRARAGPPENDDKGTSAAITMAVAAVPAIVSPMQSKLHLLGTTVATKHVQLRAPSAGRVLGFDLQNGDRVHRGEVVAHVLSREIEAATNGLAVAQRLDPDEEPTLALTVKRYSSDGGVAVVVPADGIVSQRLVSSGQMVSDMDPLAELIDPQSIYVEAAVPITNLEAISPGMDVTVTSPMVPGIAMPARVAALSPSLSSNGATSPARIEFTSGARITQAGAPVEAIVTIASVPDALVIPRAALFEDALRDNYYVFIAGSDGRAHRSAVTTGIRGADEVQVTSGVKAGDLVITTGGYALAEGLKISVTVPQK